MNFFKVLIPFFLLNFVFFSSCNSDVFVDEFLENDMEFYINDGEKNTIKFKNTNWNILGIYYKINGQVCVGNVYDIEGNLIKNNVPLEKIEGLARVKFESQFVKFKVDRLKFDELTVTGDINFNSLVSSFSIVVGNEYEDKIIDFKLKMSDKYVVDKVVYDYSKLDTVSTDIKMKKQSMKNNTNQPLEYVIKPYENIKRYVYNNLEIGGFSILSQIFGMPLPEMDIYDFDNGKPVFKGNKVSIDANGEITELPFDADVTETFIINPGERMFFNVLLTEITTKVPYILYAHNSNTGKVDEFKGVLTCQYASEYEIYSSKE